MKKSILFSGLVLAFGALSAQYYTYPNLNAGENPEGINTDGENPYPNMASGWTNIWNGGATSTPTYANSQAIPFDFEFAGSPVSTYTPSNFGTITFDNTSPSVKPSDYSNIALPSADIPDKSVCVLGIKPLGPLTSGSTNYMSAVLSKTVGSAPNRQHWIQFNFFGEANIDEGWTYWAIVLEETTNNIYIVDQKTLPVKSGQLTSGNVKLSLGIQVDGTTATSVDGSPEVKAQQTTKNIFTAEDNSYYTFVAGTQPNEDIMAKSVNMDKYLLLGDAPFDVKLDIRNLGTDALTSAEVFYSVDGGAPMGGAVNTSTNVPSLDYGTLASPSQWTPAGIGKYTLKVWSNNPNGQTDGNALNDTQIFDVQVLDALVQRKMLNEIFSSSTCGPCNPGNVNYKEVVDGKENHSTIKYQVWWPGTGDPYCTQEVRTRASFYSVSTVPRMEVDGGWDGNAGSFSASLYEETEAIPSFLKISGVAKNTWKNTISIDVELDPVADYTSTNLRLFAAIAEGKTYDNKKTNGETEFEMVMKKIMPDANGMAISSLTKGTKVAKTLSHEFKGDWRLPTDGSAAQHINHNIENSIETWDDLFVVVWVQDTETKEVIQSNTFAVASNSNESIENVVQVFPNPANESFNIKATSMANEVAKLQVVNVQGQAVYSADMNNGVHQINTQLWIPGVYMVSVEGANEHFSTKIVVNK